jgi:hypothetical protein
MALIHITFEVYSALVLNRASIVLAQQQLLLEMEHDLTPVLKRIFKTLMLIYFCYLPNPFKKATKMRSFSTASAARDIGRSFLHQLSSHLESQLNCYFF